MTSTSFQLYSAAVVGLVAGYLLKDLVLKGPFGKSKLPERPPPLSSATSDLQTTNSESESDCDVEIDSKDLNYLPGEVRMTLIVRQDLKMGKGKAATQCSHATLALYKKMSNPNSRAYNPEMLRRWEYGNGQAKITLQVPSQHEMDLLFATAMSLNINSCIVHDAGRTQIAAGSATVLGLGPAPKSVMDQVTSELKLY